MHGPMGRPRLSGRRRRTPPGPPRRPGAHRPLHPPEAADDTRTGQTLETDGRSTQPRAHIQGKTKTTLCERFCKTQKTRLRPHPKARRHCLEAIRPSWSSMACADPDGPMTCALPIARDNSMAGAVPIARAYPVAYAVPMASTVPPACADQVSAPVPWPMSSQWCATPWPTPPRTVYCFDA